MIDSFLNWRTAIIFFIDFSLDDDEKFSQEDRNVYNQWIIFLLDQDNFDKQKIESLVNKIYLAFNHYQKSRSISKNLNRFMKLSFMYKN